MDIYIYIDHRYSCTVYTRHGSIPILKCSDCCLERVHVMLKE